MKQLNKHPVLKRYEEKQEELRPYYCTKCDMDFFVTKTEFQKHLDKHINTEDKEGWE
jgi:hypothetical protein